MRNGINHMNTALVKFRNNATKVMSLTLAILLSLSLSVPVLADNYISHGKGTTDVELIQDSSKLTVTVPVGLPMYMDMDGNVFCAESGLARITNDSYGPVEVKSCRIEKTTNWGLAAFNTDFRKEKVGIKSYGFQMNEANADPSTGNINAAAFPVINGKDYITLNYDGNIAAQDNAVENQVISQVVFTVGWNSKDYAIITLLVDDEQIPLRATIGGTMADIAQSLDNGRRIIKDYVDYGSAHIMGYVDALQNYSVLVYENGGSRVYWDDPITGSVSIKLGYCYNNEKDQIIVNP